METNKLPSLIELSCDIETAFKNDDFNRLLNQPPPPSWLLKHPTVKVKNDAGQMEPLAYLPIEKVELLLTKIFQEWKVEVMDIKQLFNSVAVHVRLHYKNPTNGIWSFHDGVGAVGCQTDKGESAANLNAIKQDAVMKALPAAKSYAIKDCADHLGKLFGKDLGRRGVIEFTGSYKKADSEIDYKTIEDQLMLINTKDELNKYWDSMPEWHSYTKLQLLFDKRKKQITKS